MMQPLLFDEKPATGRPASATIRVAQAIKGRRRSGPEARAEASHHSHVRKRSSRGQDAAHIVKIDRPSRKELHRDEVFQTDEAKRLSGVVRLHASFFCLEIQPAETDEQVDPVLVVVGHLQQRGNRVITVTPADGGLNRETPECRLHIVEGVPVQEEECVGIATRTDDPVKGRGHGADDHAGDSLPGQAFRHIDQKRRRFAGAGGSQPAGSAL
jgi:hypothetical protein